MQTVHILRLVSAGIDLLPKEGFLQSNPNLLPNNLAWQSYRYTSVPKEAVIFFKSVIVLFFKKRTVRMRTLQ